MANSSNVLLVTAKNPTSFKLHSRTRRHKQYATNETEISCFRPIGLAIDPEANCRFVRHNYYCNFDTNLINYLEFAVCTVRIDEFPWYGEIGYVVCTITLLLFIVLSFFVMTKWFILPNLLTLYNWCSINDYQYGVIVVSTLIVIPSLLKNPIACNTQQQSFALYFTDLSSKTFTMYGFGLALIGVSKTFSIPPCRFIANLLMILSGHIYVVVLIHFQTKNIVHSKEEQSDLKLEWHAGFLIIVYLIYLFAHLYGPFKSTTPKKSVRPKRSLRRLPSHPRVRSESFDTDQSDLSRFSLNRPLEFPLATLPSGTIETSIVLEGVLADVSTQLAVVDNASVFKAHLRVFYGQIFGKNCIVLNILLSPIWVALTLIIPVINASRPFDGWHKYLFCANLLVIPLLLFAYTKLIFVLICFVIGFVAALSVLITTDPKLPPRLYKLFSIVGLLVAFMISHLLEMETDTLIHQCLQYAAGWNVDAAIIAGSSFFSCVAETIIINELIRKKHLDIAFGVVTGLAIYNTLCTFPCIVLQPCFDVTSTIFITKNNSTIYVFLVLMIVYTFMAVAISNFELRRSYGIFLFIFCAVFLLYLILSVYEFIHPYGSQHSSTFLYNSLLHAGWA